MTHPSPERREGATPLGHTQQGAWDAHYRRGRRFRPLGDTERALPAEPRRLPRRAAGPWISVAAWGVGRPPGTTEPRTPYPQPPRVPHTSPQNTRIPGSPAPRIKLRPPRHVVSRRAVPSTSGP
jgi:hypothetical protein